MERDLDEHMIGSDNHNALRLRAGWFADLKILLVAASDVSWDLARVTATIETELAHARAADQADVVAVLERVVAARG